MRVNCCNLSFVNRHFLKPVRSREWKTRIQNWPRTFDTTKLHPNVIFRVKLRLSFKTRKRPKFKFDLGEPQTLISFSQQHIYLLLLVLKKMLKWTRKMTRVYCVLSILLMYSQGWECYVCDSPSHFCFPFSLCCIVNSSSMRSLALTTFDWR